MMMSNKIVVGFFLLIAALVLIDMKWHPSLDTWVQLSQIGAALASAIAVIIAFWQLNKKNEELLAQNKMIKAGMPPVFSLFNVAINKEEYMVILDFRNHGGSAIIDEQSRNHHGHAYLPLIDIAYQYSSQIDGLVSSEDTMKLVLTYEPGSDFEPFPITLTIGFGPDVHGYLKRQSFRINSIENFESSAPVRGRKLE